MLTMTPSDENGPSPSLSAEEALRLMEAVDIAFGARSLDELATNMLQPVASLTQSPSAVLYVADPRLSASGFFEDGTLAGSASEVKSVCSEQLAQFSASSDLSSLTVSSSPVLSSGCDWRFHPLVIEDECNSLVGLAVPEEPITVSPEVVKKLINLLTHAIGRLAERAAADRQLTHLNTYLTVSSLLVQSFNLHEMLEGVLYCCLDAVSAEAASVLLLEEDMKTFRLYQTEGPAKPTLTESTTTLLQDIAGYVLQTQQPVVIPKMESDPRFVVENVSEPHFRTRNLIAVPLAIGEEQIGTLVVLNKVNGGAFTSDEKMLLVSVAGEIALAIRNAKIFEFVANVYCRRRQGEFSCKGCERPLGTWTPCVEFQDHVTVSGLWRISDEPV